MLMYKKLYYILILVFAKKNGWDSCMGYHIRYLGGKNGPLFVQIRLMI